jgi:hypothetical protein
MHNESIHRYRIPSRRVIKTASWNVLGKLANAIPRFIPSMLFVKVLTSWTFPQQWLKQTYLPVSSWVSHNLTLSLGLFRLDKSPTSITRRGSLVSLDSRQSPPCFSTQFLTKYPIRAVRVIAVGSGSRWMESCKPFQADGGSGSSTKILVCRQEGRP